MQYMILIYEDENGYMGKAGTPEMKSVTERHFALVKELGDVRISAAGLQSTHTATTVRTENGQQVVHDGPFAETREQLGGYYLIEAPDLDAAIAVAKRVPLRGDGAIEVRPLIVH